MHLPDTEITLAALVTGRPALAPVLDELGLDYCCGGGQTLGEAITAAGLDLDATLETLADERPTPPSVDGVDWTALGPAELTEHLEATHHVFLKGVLPRLDDLAAKVAGVHGDRHPELHDVLATLRELRADLEPHLMKEERILFPMIRELAAASDLPSFHCGSLGNPIGVMGAEHDRAGQLLGRLRELTGGYRPPDDGCASYQAFYCGLAELEADTHLHVHKENNLLFPATLEAECTLAAGT
jgi:regulator of cell morphogenesis and NO signaling